MNSRPPSEAPPELFDSSDDPRHQALRILYEMAMSDGLGAGHEELLEGKLPKASLIVRGVLADVENIDLLIERAAQGWRANRMPAVDLTVLRMAVYELRHHSRTPVAVIISEAVRMAGEYSTERSGRFVNGVLATLAARIRPDEAARPVQTPSGSSASRRRAEQALLVTADGEVFRGWSVGDSGTTVGEVVFNTAMSGYQEVFTDPSYAGQIVVMTSPHIGNYGVTALDSQSGGPAAAGVVMRAYSRRYSSWRAEGDLSEFFAEHGLVAVAGIDTRRLTRHIRDRGAMPAAMGGGASLRELTEMAAAAPVMVGQDLASAVSTADSYTVSPSGATRGTVVAIDLGIKRDILEHLTRRGLEVRVMPSGASASDILEAGPDGVFLSNGPGDPEPLKAAITTIRGILGKTPVFGICLGQQVLGLALGADTYKLPFGHHGGNHPVRRLSDGKVEITSQNHGFAVDLWSLSSGSAPARKGLVTPKLLPEVVESEFGAIAPTHQNLNDGTLEGMECRDIPAFAVQYHPEAAPGPRDAVGLFDEFLRLMDRGV
ncbi:MAG: glutamine-hydrolyzing carbamoyl-phosphate synthase small subunit [Acidimicrobiia bacterium]|nr:glutamine-hydrolyzing carbamoyl-phosphate synthase small subunit [Acidimicrobiia bacterium]MYG92349.1 glutamine-hydrolyzing carbamoyl-phosphate synthase small subunit [Acidimicrobiia bacterium]MYK56712.1 glutamine-hydrolyzing carbamoyl-phosphate synthase small subunit [Acidimicrobiia bacterium]